MTVFYCFSKWTKVGERDILKRRLVDGIAFESLGEEFHLSTQRIKVIVYQGIDELSLHS